MIATLLLGQILLEPSGGMKPLKHRVSRAVSRVACRRSLISLESPLFDSLRGKV
jgi:hypothetical protein